MLEPLTRVEILFLPEFVNHWLRFGEPDAWRDRDRRRAQAYFRPGRVFGYLRWEANDYGTKDWRFFVLRARSPGNRVWRVPGVAPGGEILLHAKGAAGVKKALRIIDRIEALDMDPARVSPSYYRHLHNRILTRLPIRPYAPERHRAHLALREIAP